MAAVPEKAAAPVLSGCSLVRNELAKYSDWDVDVMAAISMAESGCNPAKNNLTATETHKRTDGSVICIGSYGALQIGCLHHPAAPGELNDIALNVAKAYDIYKGRGNYTAWSVFTNGKYLQFYGKV